ncbi:hypothetical protein FOZ60_015428 [Perkinsus olseni]|uniref:Uncharacterized protein n=1 Tax=Perkinsus olseni TaxID=32597 RepID=A0A7J6P7V5_PEROL|nr:hypothetical protein FOZ60_015428 [Perkinsus olseni]
MAATTLVAAPTMITRRPGSEAGGLREGSSSEISAQGEESSAEEGFCRGHMRELIVYVEPRKDSELYRRLAKARKEALALFGPDESYLYGLHSSVTGFFTASTEEAQAVLLELHWAFLPSLESSHGRGMTRLDDAAAACTAGLPALRSTGSSSTVSSLCSAFADEQSPSSLASMVTAASSDYPACVAKGEVDVDDEPKDDNTVVVDDAPPSVAASTPPVRVEDLLVSPDGCVLLSIRYDQILDNVRSAVTGLTKDKIRYKKRAHLTLAKNRLGEEGAAVSDFYRKQLGRPASEFEPTTGWDLVVYERAFRSESLEEQGPHVLNELVRFPLQ